MTPPYKRKEEKRKEKIRKQHSRYIFLEFLPKETKTQKKKKAPSSKLERWTTQN
jgi:hypothetical protein